MSEPLRATFFALRPRDRAVLLPATLVLIVLLAALIGLFLAINWNGISALMHASSQSGGGKVSDEQALGAVAGIFTLIGSVFLLMIPFYIVVAAYEAACLRWMIRGETPGLFGFALDHDTWRVYGVYWCWVAVHFAVSMAMSIVTFPLMISMMSTVMTEGKIDPEAMWHWQMTVQLPLTLLQYLPLIILGVRFGPAAATSVLRRRFSFLDAWKVTRGRFLSLLGSFASLWLLWAIIGAAVFVAVYGILFRDVLASVSTWFSAWPPSEDAARTIGQQLFQRIFSPQGLLAYAVSAGVNVIVLFAYATLTYGINARAALAALDDGKIDIPAQT